MLLTRIKTIVNRQYIMRLPRLRRRRVALYQQAAFVARHGNELHPAALAEVVLAAYLVLHGIAMGIQHVDLLYT